MNLNKLKGKIVEKGMNVEILGAMIGIERTTLYRKLNNFERITIGEANRIKTALELSDEDAIEIFLS